MNLFNKSINWRGIFLLMVINFFFTSCFSQGVEDKVQIQTGAEQIHQYLPMLQGKRIALIVNQTSIIGNTHIVDTLMASGVNIKKVFAPEHGFRGEADAGEVIQNDIDPKTSLPIISLYGKNKKPTSAQLADVDIVIFDIQDVGARFYTYISTMHYAMEACAENKKKFIVLDRPNPNGHYVDGPILEKEHQSFVGIHPIPIVHGLTVGELAFMINGEKWLKDNLSCELEVIKNVNYTHDSTYMLPVKPSPNLPNHQAILLYPSICFFEGTPISLGRGTEFPFQVIGFPDEKFGSFTFTPQSSAGAKSPPHMNKKCYGRDLRNVPVKSSIDLSYLIDFYQKSEKKNNFFTSFFKLLAGTEELQNQIIEGYTEEEIKKSWEAPLSAYKEKRKNYLLYPDFTESK